MTEDCAHVATPLAQCTVGSALGDVSAAELPAAAAAGQYHPSAATPEALQALYEMLQGTAQWRVDYLQAEVLHRHVKGAPGGGRGVLIVVHDVDAGESHIVWAPYSLVFTLNAEGVSAELRIPVECLLDVPILAESGGGAPPLASFADLLQDHVHLPEWRRACVIPVACLEQMRKDPKGLFADKAVTLFAAGDGGAAGQHGPFLFKNNKGYTRFVTEVKRAQQEDALRRAEAAPSIEGTIMNDSMASRTAKLEKLLERTWATTPPASPGGARATPTSHSPASVSLSGCATPAPRTPPAAAGPDLLSPETPITAGLLFPDYSMHTDEEWQALRGVPVTAEEWEVYFCPAEAPSAPPVAVCTPADAALDLAATPPTKPQEAWMADGRRQGSHPPPAADDGGATRRALALDGASENKGSRQGSQAPSEASRAVDGEEEEGEESSRPDPESGPEVDAAASNQTDDAAEPPPPPANAPAPGEQERVLSVANWEAAKARVFASGLDAVVRAEVWEYLLGIAEVGSTAQERAARLGALTEEYHVYYTQWASMTEAQLRHNAAYRDTRMRVEKDVVRTDRTIDVFTDDKGDGLKALMNVLMCYSQYNADLAYCQGMSDVAASLYYVFRCEVKTFWGLVAVMHDRGLIRGFQKDQSAIACDLESIGNILHLCDPEFVEYLTSIDALNFQFCFRWIVVHFKREFSFDEVLRLWDVMWTCPFGTHYHLLLAAGVIHHSRVCQDIENGRRDFDQILRIMNDMSQNIPLDFILHKTHKLYLQLVDSHVHFGNALPTIEQIAETRALENVMLRSPQGRKY